MKYDPAKHHRKSIRLKGFDYSQEAAYFITLVTQGRECLFGEVIDGEMQLNAAGEIITSAWLGMESRFPQVQLDEFVIMPNHFHAIISVGATLVVAPDMVTREQGVGATLVVAHDVVAHEVVAPDVVAPEQGVGATLVVAHDVVAHEVVAPDVVAREQGVGATLVVAHDVVAPEQGVGATLVVAHEVVAPEQRAGTSPAPTNAIVKTTLGDIVGAFKSIATHEYILAVRRGNLPPFAGKIWQRNYYEHIIRNERDWERIRQYIRENPARWAEDMENPTTKPMAMDALNELAEVLGDGKNDRVTKDAH
jgi:REP element-mobilizing transposase RayT